MPDDGPKPGPWSNDVAPYLTEFMRAFFRHRIKIVVLVSPAQVGKTEALFNVLGRMFHLGPRVPALLLLATEKLARSMARDRIDKMLRTVGALWAGLDKRASHNSLLEKYIYGARLGIGWMGSSVEFKSHPAGVVLLDEIDEVSEDVGGQGDPVLMALARLKRFPSGKLGLTSTPSRLGFSRIMEWWEAGTMQRWCWRCPSCEHWFPPTSDDLRWSEDDDDLAILENAWVECPACEHVIRDSDRPGLTTAWRGFRAGENEGEYVDAGAPRASRNATFWITGPAVAFQPLGELALLLRDAKRSKQPAKLQAVLNQYFGEPYVATGDAPRWHEVFELRRDYEGVPDGAAFLTCGVDVQKDCLYYVVRAWGYNATSWRIDAGQIYGATEHEPVWLALDATLDMHRGGYAIKATFIDSGFTPGDQWLRPENIIYKFCRRRPFCWPTRGRATQDKPLRASKPDVTRTGRQRQAGLTVWTVHTDHWKTWLYGRIRWPGGEPGEWLVPMNVTEDYCKQVVNEQLVISPTGQREWKRTGTRENHYLDCEVLAAAAAYKENVNRLPPPGGEKTPPPRPPPRPLRRGL